MRAPCGELPRGVSTWADRYYKFYVIGLITCSSGIIFLPVLENTLASLAVQVSALARAAVLVCTRSCSRCSRGAGRLSPSRWASNIDESLNRITRPMPGTRAHWHGCCMVFSRARKPERSVSRSEVNDTSLSDSAAPLVGQLRKMAHGNSSTRGSAHFGRFAMQHSGAAGGDPCDPDCPVCKCDSLFHACVVAGALQA